MTTNRCGNIEYVPFIEHPNGPDYIPKFDSSTEEFLDDYDTGSIYHIDYQEIIGKLNQTRHKDNQFKLNSWIHQKYIHDNQNKLLSNSNIDSNNSTSSLSSILFIIVVFISVFALLGYIAKSLLHMIQKNERSSQQLHEQQSKQKSVDSHYSNYAKSV